MKISRIILFSIVFLSLSFNGFSIDSTNHSKESNYRNVEEFLYVHTDRDVYIAGENIFFKLYLLNSSKSIEIENSKIAYLVIRNADQRRIVESRIWLDNNTGFGKIHIPDTLSTGFYQIVAFTNWMKEEFEFYRFNKEIFIANRFDKDVSLYSDRVNYQANLSRETKNAIKQINSDNDSSCTINLSVSKTAYNPRSKVTLNALFKSNDLNDSIAEISISVMEPDSSFSHERDNIKDIYYLYHSEKDNKTRINYKNIETKGLIVSGRVVNIDSIGVGNQVVFLSTPDSIVNLQYDITDPFGNFQFMLSSYYESKNLFIGLMNNDKVENYSIIIDEKYLCSIPFNTYNDITNTQCKYINKLQDVSTVNKSFEIEFVKDISSDYSYFYCPQLYSKPDYRVYTSEFLHLNQLDVMIQEMLYGVKINKSDQNSVSIFDFTLNQNYSNSFVFLDGVPFFNFNEIIGFGSDKVKRLEVINSTWVLDNFLFKGILSVFTHNYEINNFKNRNNKVVIPAGEYLPRAKFLSPDYTVTTKNNRIPDFREMLYWNPQLELKRNEVKGIDFFTSDICSEFLIKVEGLSQKGKPLYTSVLIKVIND